MNTFTNVMLRPQMLAFIEATRLINFRAADGKALPEAVEAAGERYNAHDLLVTYSRAERFPQPAPAELVEAAGDLASVFAAPTIGDIGEALFLTAERLRLFHHMRTPARATTAGGFRPMVEVTETPARGPAKEPISRELRDLRAIIVAKPATPSSGPRLAILSGLARRFRAEEPYPKAVELVEGGKRRTVATEAFLRSFDGDRELCPNGFDWSGLPFTYSAPLGDPTPPLALVAETLLTEGKWRGAL